MHCNVSEGDSNRTSENPGYCSKSLDSMTCVISGGRPVAYRMLCGTAHEQKTTRQDGRQRTKHKMWCMKYSSEVAGELQNHNGRRAFRGAAGV